MSPQALLQAQRPTQKYFSFSALKKLAFFFGTLALYIALSLVKMRYYFEDGRFWAEEGTRFVRGIYGLDLLDAIFWIYHGHLEMVTNLVVYVSSLTSFERAPLVTTYLSLLVQALPVMVVIAYRAQLKLSKWSVLAWVVILVGIPQGNEVWANSINLHFHLALLVAIIAAIPPQHGWQRHPLRGAILVSGLSGIPANFLAPVFFWLAVKEKDTERWVLFGILAATTALQISLLLFSGSHLGHRTYEFDSVVFLLSTVSQSFLFPLFGADIGRHIGFLLVHNTLEWEVFGLVLVAALLWPIILLIAALWRHGSRSEWTLLVSAAVLAALSFWLALGPERTPFVSGGGGRYWYAPNALLFLSLLIFLNRLKIRTGQFFLILVVVTSLHSIHSDRLRGPQWAEEYQRAVAEGERRVPIWPGGWYIWIPETAQVSREG